MSPDGVIKLGSMSPLPQICLNSDSGMSGGNVGVSEGSRERNLLGSQPLTSTFNNGLLPKKDSG